MVNQLTQLKTKFDNLLSAATAAPSASATSSSTDIDKLMKNYVRTMWLTNAIKGSSKKKCASPLDILTMSSLGLPDTTSSTAALAYASLLDPSFNLVDPFIYPGVVDINIDVGEDKPKRRTTRRRGSRRQRR